MTIDHALEQAKFHLEPEVYGVLFDAILKPKQGVDKTKLGIGKEPLLRRNYLYVKYNENEDKVSHFYLFGGNKGNTLFYEDHLTGYLRHAMLYMHMDGDIEVPKLRLFIEADNNYVLSSGIKTQFSLGVLRSLLLLGPDELAEPIIIRFENNRENKKARNLVFGRVDTFKRSLFASHNTRKGEDMLLELQTKLGFPTAVGRREKSEFDEPGDDD